MGDAELVDAMVHDGLWDAFDDAHMGGLSDQVNQRLGIGRAAQDEWSARSHERAAEATKNGVLGEEIALVAVAQRKGEVTVDQDEGIRPGTTAEALGRLRRRLCPMAPSPPATPLQISDGAAAWSSPAAGGRRGPSRARLDRGLRERGRPDTSLHSQPSRAIVDACRRARVAIDDSDLVDLRGLPPWPWRRLGSWGWTRGSSTSTAARSPSATRIGASGTRVVLTLAWSCAAAAAGSARPPCAAAAARVTPCWSGRGVILPGAAGTAAGWRCQAVARLISGSRTATATSSGRRRGPQPAAGRAQVIGLTGSPVGKSTLAGALVAAYRARG